MINIKDKKELTFLLISILMAVIVTAGIVYSIRFLASQIKVGLEPAMPSEGYIQHFSIDAVERLK